MYDETKKYKPGDKINYSKNLHILGSGFHVASNNHMGNSNASPASVAHQIGQPYGGKKKRGGSHHSPIAYGGRVGGRVGYAGRIGYAGRLGYAGKMGYAGRIGYAGSMGYAGRVKR